MDILPTQVYDDEEFMPTQRISIPVQDEDFRQVGTLLVGSDTYPINKGINIIGRSIACDITINDQTVSKQHAEIEANTAQVSAWICDLNSSNKTKLNNLVLRAGRCYELKDGSTIEFGRVCATYKVHRSMDESVVPETPAPLRQKLVQPIIPGTPDSSLNNSSALEGDLSTVPGTQGDGEESVFRRPSLNPQRLSMPYGKRSYGRDSSLDNSVENSRNLTVQQRSSVNEVETGVSISDMETQKPFDSHSASDLDIHDIETQRISLGGLKNTTPTGKASLRQSGIHDAETQQHQIDIHDVETQPPENDIHTMETPKIERYAQNALTGGDQNVKVSSKLEAKETEENRREIDMSDLETQRVGDAQGKSLDKEFQERDSDAPSENTCAADNASKTAATTKNSENTVALSQTADASSQEFLKLSLTLNFEEDCSEFERSVDQLGSQNLLEGLEENNVSVSSAGEKSKTSTPIKSSHAKAGSEAREQSTDDESMFDAATQKNNDDGNVYSGVTQRVSYQFPGSLMEDDSETDEEGVFQRYSRDGDQEDSKTCTNARRVDSENSDTDEEGRFTELAIKEKRNASLSFEVDRGGKEGAKEESRASRDSDDIFDAPTQRINATMDEMDHVPNVSSMKDKIDVDRTLSDNPTLARESQRSAANKRVELDKNSEIEDTAPTQVIQLSGSPFSNASICIAKCNDTLGCVEGNTAMDDLPTQLIDASKSRSCTTDDESPLLSGKSNSNSLGDIGDIDYEMAPTQVITDIEAKRTNVPAALTKNNDAGMSSEKPNLDDTVERNLNEMFDDVNDECTLKPPEISTQSLEEVLQFSQTANESRTTETDADSNSPTKALKKSKTVARGKEETSAPQSERRTRRSNVKNKPDVDPQNTQEYSSPLRSARKRSALVESQDEAAVSNKDESVQKDENSRILKSNMTSPTIASKAGKSLSSNSTGESRNSEADAPKSGPLTTETAVSSEPSQHVSDKATPEINVMDDSDDDFFSRLPEVRISGTLSNPGTPTSSVWSEPRLSISEDSPKRGGAKKTAKKPPPPRDKLPRKVSSRKNTENGEPYRTISNAQSVYPKNLSISFSGSVEIDKVSVETNDSDATNKNVGSTNTKSSMRKTFAGDLRGSITPRRVTFSQQKPTSSIESSKVDNKCNSLERPTNNNMTVRTNKKTSLAEEQSDDRPSVFQVTNEALIQNTTGKATKRKSMIVSRSGKRSLNTDNENEQTEAKKHKAESTNGAAVATTRSKKSTAKAAAARKKQSANILDFLTKANSPVNTRYSQEGKNVDEGQLLSQRAVVNVIRISSDTRRASTGSNSTDYEIKLNRQNGANNQDSPSIIGVSTDKKTNQTVNSQKERYRGRNTRQLLNVKDVSPDTGEESQEVEMIMKNVSLKDESSSARMAGKNTAKGTKGAKTRNTRKRQNTTVTAETDTAQTTASSDVNEHDDAHFEVPVTKAKRMRGSKNPPPALLKAPEKVNTISEPPTRSTRSSQKSSTESFTDDSTGESSQDGMTANIVLTKPKTRRGRPTKNKTINAKKVETNMHGDRSTSSAMDSSIDVASVVSTPSRARRSTSSFLNTSLSSQVKHKILFTGLSSDEYRKAVTKLGALQVEDPAKCTVLVTDKVRRTVKFLCALAQSTPIVSIDWLTDSEQVGYFVDLENYILKDPSAEAKFGFKLRGSLAKAKKCKFLDGYTIVLTPNVAPPPLPELKSIVTSCGGKPLVRPPTSWPERAVIVSREEDLTAAKKFLAKAPKSVTIQSTEFLLTGILRQELDFVKHRLT